MRCTAVRLVFLCSVTLPAVASQLQADFNLIDEPVKATKPFPAARGVLERYAGEAAARRFVFEKMDSPEPAAEVSAHEGRILVRATDENRAAAAVGRYVREIAGGHFGRCGNRVPTDWPLPKSPLRVKGVLPQFHAYNYCVFAYSFAFLSDADWRANIDRLALCGFTSAAVTTGNAKVWQLFLRDAGFSEAQIAAYLPDETGQPWMNCGGEEGLGAPLPADAVDRDARQGAMIVRELRALGIEPMLQGFTGLLPNSSTNVLTGAAWPDARICDQGLWADSYKRPVLLDATTDAYRRLAKLWYRRLFEVYGVTSSKYFIGNLFSEGGDARTLDCPAVAAAMQREQQVASPGAIWCISCWGSAPRQDLLDGLNPDLTRIIVLDRNMANGGVFPRGFGKMTWLWGELLNFGNNDGLYGGLDALERLDGHRTGRNGRTLHGYALESEGLDTNPWFYELFTDLFFRRDLLTGEGATSRWFADYARRRYGVDDARIRAAFDLLAESVWRVNRMQEGCSESVFCSRPCWNPRAASTWSSREPLYYDPSAVERAARHFLAVAREKPELLKLETFRFDFTDLFRQVLSDRGRALAPRLRDEAAARGEFLELMRRTDELLACTEAFRLDVLEARARARSGERGVRSLRRMLTTWTDGTRSPLNDYAHRQLAGLFSNYYLPRWQMFFDSQDGIDRRLDAFAKASPQAIWTMPPRGGDLIALASCILEQ